IECEQAILDYLCKINFPIRVVSEEHGVVECHPNPQYLGVLDGLDGSGVYKEAPGTGRYATMFGIFSGLNPRYEDYFVFGIVEHALKTIYIGEKGMGAYLINSNKEKKPIHCADTQILDTSIDIRIDECWETNRTIFSDPLISYNTSCGKCSAIYYADVATGKASLALECTRKGNLELAVAYGLIREAGGVMVDLNGQDIGKQEYLSFGQEPNDHLPIITAATPELASSLVRYLQDKVG
ncbi:MAG: hypothetical protein HYV41_02930, partial [Candidatus Magasanikbacteria bacterium]|nr:hypothetical protein [Candidatus Magasanikbacteria bacterium]